MMKMNLETNNYYNEENNWLLTEARVFDEKFANMIDVNLTVIDLNKMMMLEEQLEDVWEYNWELIK